MNEWLLLCTSVIAQIRQRPRDHVAQQMWLAVLLQPGNHSRRQFRKVVHWQVFEGQEHLLHYRLEHLKLDIIRDTRLRLPWAALLVLQHLFVARLDHRETGDLLLQCNSLVVLFLLVLVQVEDVLDGLLEHGRLAQLVPGRLVLLACGHEVLQSVVALLDRIPSLLLRLRVRLPATLLVAGHGRARPVVAVVLVVCVVRRGAGRVRVQAARAAASRVVVQNFRFLRTVRVAAQRGSVRGGGGRTWRGEGYGLIAVHFDSK